MSAGEARVVTARAVIDAPASEIFEQIADPSPAEPGAEPPGHLWRWELTPLESGGTEIVHTYDWTDLDDESRLPRARATSEASLRASIERLAAPFA